MSGRGAGERRVEDEGSVEKGDQGGGKGGEEDKGSVEKGDQGREGWRRG